MARASRLSSKVLINLVPTMRKVFEAWKVRRGWLGVWRGLRRRVDRRA
jgi:hypothetical protein